MYSCSVKLRGIFKSCVMPLIKVSAWPDWCVTLETFKTSQKTEEEKEDTYTNAV